MKQGISILMLIFSFNLFAQKAQPKSFVVDGNTISIESFNRDCQARNCPGYNVIQNFNIIDSLDGGQYGYPAEFDVIESRGSTYLLFDNNYYYPFGLTFRRYCLLSLNAESYLDTLFYKSIEIYRESNKVEDGEYVYYINKNQAEIMFLDNISITNHITVSRCPESVDTCTELEKTRDVETFNLEK